MPSPISYLADVCECGHELAFHDCSSPNPRRRYCTLCDCEAYTRTRLRVITFDCSGDPERGDLLLTAGVRGVGTVYQIVRAREIRRRDPEAGKRHRLVVRTILRKPTNKQLAMFDGKSKWFLQWQSRNKRTKTFEQYMRRHEKTS